MNKKTKAEDLSQGVVQWVSITKILMEDLQEKAKRAVEIAERILEVWADPDSDPRYPSLKPSDASDPHALEEMDRDVAHLIMWVDRAGKRQEDALADARDARRCIDSLREIHDPQFGTNPTPRPHSQTQPQEEDTQT